MVDGWWLRKAVTDKTVTSKTSTPELALTAVRCRRTSLPPLLLVGAAAAESQSGARAIYYIGIAFGRVGQYMREIRTRSLPHLQRCWRLLHEKVARACRDVYGWLLRSESERGHRNG